jgi:putative MATE family efflux protein
MKGYDQMTDSKPRIGLGKQLFVLAAPLAMQNIITYSVGLADNIMVGKLGEFALSGVYVANIIQTMLHMTVAGLSAGLIVLASQYWGKKDTGSIKILTSFALKLAFCISLLLWGAVFFFPEKVLSLLTSDANVITEGVKYVRIICFTYMLFTTTNVLLASQRCVENVRIGMYLSLLTLISNVFLNWVLIFGKLGFPALGVQGAAIATLISRVLEFAVLAVYIRKFDRKLNIRIPDLLASSKLLRNDFIKYGLPVIIGDITWGLNLSTQGAIIGHLGAASIAATSVANTVFSIVSVGVYGVASASAVIIGKTVGSGDYNLVRHYTKRLQLIFLCGGIITGAFLFAVKGPILNIYSSLDPDTLRISSQLLTVLSVTIIGTAYQMSSLTGIVRAGGATHFVLINDLIFVWLIVIPSAALAAFVFGAPTWIVFACLKSDQVLKCAVAVVKVNRMKWIKNLTRETKGAALTNS